MKLYLLRGSENMVSNLYKIGVTEDLDRRVRDLRRRFGYVKLVGDFEVEGVDTEQIVHGILSDKRVFLEWFALDTEDVDNFHRFVRQAKRICENGYGQSSVGAQVLYFNLLHRFGAGCYCKIADSYGLGDGEEDNALMELDKRGLVTLLPKHFFRLNAISTH